jgi:hypothetical protein
VLYSRRLVFSHRCWAVVLLATALLFKVMIPVGFMPVANGKTLTVELCSSSRADRLTIHIPMESSSKKGGDLAQQDQSCVFGGLGQQALPAVDPIVLAAAIAFVFTQGLLTADLRLPQERIYLRPPLRGPPALF